MQLGIITGGYGPERPGALLSGKHVHEACVSLGIRTTLFDAAELDFRELEQVERAFLTTHGWYGEDGKLQGALDLLRIPYSGSGVAASAAAYFKPFANAIAENSGLRIPRSRLIDLRRGKLPEPRELFGTLGPQVFVKPAANGCSQGAQILSSANDFNDWVSTAAGDELPLFVAAQFIPGKDISVGIIEIAGVPVALPLLETRHDEQFYSFEVKSGNSRRAYVCPAEISKSEEYSLKEKALSIYSSLGCRGFARVDFILNNTAPWFLEVNTLPGLSRHGNLAQMGYALKWDYEDLIFRLIETIETSRKYRP